jgi:CRP/FNR family cyclic AMP-dependent transcriptional regulator
LNDDIDLGYLRRVPFLDCLNDHYLSFIHRHVRERDVAAGQTVFHEGESADGMLYLVLRGRMKIFHSDLEGREVVLSIAAAGDYFGELALIDRQPRSASVAALDDTVLRIVPWATVQAELASRPEMAMAVMTALIDRVRELTERVRTLALGDVYHRVVRQLLTLARDDGDIKALPGRYTHQMLADMVGSSRERVSHVMSVLGKAGVVRASSGRLLVLRQPPADWAAARQAAAGR